MIPSIFSAFFLCREHFGFSQPREDFFVVGMWKWESVGWGYSAPWEWNSASWAELSDCSCLESAQPFRIRGKSKGVSRFLPRGLSKPRFSLAKVVAESWNLFRWGWISMWHLSASLVIRRTLRCWVLQRLAMKHQSVGMFEVSVGRLLNFLCRDLSSYLIDTLLVLVELEASCTAPAALCPWWFGRLLCRR